MGKTGRGDRWIKSGDRELGDVYNTLNLPYVHTQLVYTFMRHSVVIIIIIIIIKVLQL